MNPFVLSFADGTTFFIGMALVLAAEGLLYRFRNRFTRPVFTVTAIVGMIPVIISATALPIRAYAMWTIPAVIGLFLLNRERPEKQPRRICVAVLAAATTALILMEAPYHRQPKLDVPAGATVYVIGDSISAAMDTKPRSWPTVLDERTSLRIVNLAQPGATVKTALEQAENIAEPRSLVIVEIGGNDLLGGTSARMFRSGLKELLASLRESQHDVLLLELPLFPFRNAYGKAQRMAVETHGGVLLPKRNFTKVLGTRDATLDGLHLSQTGHNAMADVIVGVLNVR